MFMKIPFREIGMFSFFSLDVLEINSERPDSWFSRALKRNSEYRARRMLRLEVAGGRPEGRAQKRFSNVAKRDAR